MEGKQTVAGVLRAFLRSNARHASAVIFFLGFTLDLFTLPRIDHPAVPYIVGGHMAVIGASIILDRLLAERGGMRFERIRGIFPLLAAFSIGAILSFLFVYYARSSAPGASWPFLVFLGAAMVGSEFFRKKLEGLRFYVILFSFLLILLSILFTPMVFGSMTPMSFIISLGIGLMCAAAYIGLLFLVAPRDVRIILPWTGVVVIAGVLLLFGSYHFGIMPAIPLVLKDGDIYRQVIRTPDGNYLREGGASLWYNGMLFPRLYDWTPGTPAYFYSAVFAPTNLSGTIVHDWQYKNTQGKWVSMTRVPFLIYGGRESGYRGYSEKEQLMAGEWRVVVSLSDGRVIGRVPFRVRVIAQ